VNVGLLAAEIGYQFGVPVQISTAFASWQRYCTAFSSGRQPNFAALNRGRHYDYSAGRSSRWALAYISSSSFFPRLISAAADWMSAIGPYFHTWCGLSANLRCSLSFEPLVIIINLSLHFCASNFCQKFRGCSNTLLVTALPQGKMQKYNGLSDNHRGAIITSRKSHMSFRLVPKLVTLNDLEQRNDAYFALFHRIRSLPLRTA